MGASKHVKANPRDVVENCRSLSPGVSGIEEEVTSGSESDTDGTHMLQQILQELSLSMSTTNDDTSLETRIKEAMANSEDNPEETEEDDTNDNETEVEDTTLVESDEEESSSEETTSEETTSEEDQTETDKEPTEICVEDDEEEEEEDVEDSEKADDDSTMKRAKETEEKILRMLAAVEEEAGTLSRQSSRRSESQSSRQSSRQSSTLSSKWSLKSPRTNEPQIIRPPQFGKSEVPPSTKVEKSVDGESSNTIDNKNTMGALRVSTAPTENTKVESKPPIQSPSASSYFSQLLPWARYSNDSQVRGQNGEFEKSGEDESSSVVSGRSHKKEVYPSTQEQQTDKSSRPSSPAVLVLESEGIVARDPSELVNERDSSIVMKKTEDVGTRNSAGSEEESESASSLSAITGKAVPPSRAIKLKAVPYKKEVLSVGTSSSALQRSSRKSTKEGKGGKISKSSSVDKRNESSAQVKSAKEVSSSNNNEDALEESLFHPNGSTQALIAPVISKEWPGDELLADDSLLTPSSATQPKKLASRKRIMPSLRSLSPIRSLSPRRFIVPKPPKSMFSFSSISTKSAKSTASESSAMPSRHPENNNVHPKSAKDRASLPVTISNNHSSSGVEPASSDTSNAGKTTDSVDSKPGQSSSNGSKSKSMNEILMQESTSSVSQDMDPEGSEEQSKIWSSYSVGLGLPSGRKRRKGWSARGITRRHGMLSPIPKELETPMFLDGAINDQQEERSRRPRKNKRSKSIFRSIAKYVKGKPIPMTVIDEHPEQEADHGVDDVEEPKHSTSDTQDEGSTGVGLGVNSNTIESSGLDQLPEKLKKETMKGVTERLGVQEEDDDVVDLLTKRIKAMETRNKELQALISHNQNRNSVDVNPTDTESILRSLRESETKSLETNSTTGSSKSNSDREVKAFTKSPNNSGIVDGRGESFNLSQFHEGFEQKIGVSVGAKGHPFGERSQQGIGGDTNTKPRPRIDEDAEQNQRLESCTGSATCTDSDQGEKLEQEMGTELTLSMIESDFWSGDIYAADKDKRKNKLVRLEKEAMTKIRSFLPDFRRKSKSRRSNNGGLGTESDFFPETEIREEENGFSVTLPALNKEEKLEVAEGKTVRTGAIEGTDISVNPEKEKLQFGSSSHFVESKSDFEDMVSKQKPENKLQTKTLSSRVIPSDELRQSADKRKRAEKPDLRIDTSLGLPPRPPAPKEALVEDCRDDVADVSNTGSSTKHRRHQQTDQSKITKVNPHSSRGMSFLRKKFAKNPLTRNISEGSSFATEESRFERDPGVDEESSYADWRASKTPAAVLSPESAPSWTSVERKIDASLKKVERLADHYDQDISTILHGQSSLFSSYSHESDYSSRYDSQFLSMSESTMSRSVSEADSMSEYPIGQSASSEGWNAVERKIDYSLLKVERLADRMLVNQRNKFFLSE